MDEWRKNKYGKAPINAIEILHEFEKTEIFENLGRSIHRDRAVLFNTVQIEKKIEN